MDSIFNKVKGKKKPPPCLGKEMPIQVQDVNGTLNRQDQRKNTPHHITDKILNIQSKKRILKTERGKAQCRPTRIIANFSMETVKARRA